MLKLTSSSKRYILDLRNRRLACLSLGLEGLKDLGKMVSLIIMLLTNFNHKQLFHN